MLVDGVDRQEHVLLVMLKDQQMENVTVNLGSTTLETYQILAQIVPLWSIANLASIIIPIVCGVVQVQLVENGELGSDVVPSMNAHAPSTILAVTV